MEKARDIEVQKRDLTFAKFEKKKITEAIVKAHESIYGKVSDKEYHSYNEIAKGIEILARQQTHPLTIYEIEELVFEGLVDKGYSRVARVYEGYRSVREFQRKKNTIDDKVAGLMDGTNKSALDENSNKNQKLISTQRDLTSEEVSKDMVLRSKFPPHIVQAHNEGIIHIHDLGHYLNESFNCCLVNLKDMLGNGTVINGKMIEPQSEFRTACTVATQIVAQVASGQFGGQTISLAHLSPYVRTTKEKIEKTVRRKYVGYAPEAVIVEDIKEQLQKEISAGIQTLNYQINTLQTSNGQSPFLSVFMYIDEEPEYEEETALLIEEMFKQRLQGMKNEVGEWITPAFPKLLYVTDVNNIYPESKYYYLSELAAKCIAKRMMPDLISAKHMRQNYEGNVFGCMGCRAWLSPYKGEINNKKGEYKWYGRFNMGLTSINLADVGLSAEGDIDKFWRIFDSRLELCYETLMHRYHKLENTTSDVSPIHWQHGAMARLDKHEPIKPLLQSGYSTISLGYIGIYECVKALIGQSHTTKEGELLALNIVQCMRAKVEEWKERSGLGFALYGTPSESLTEKFAKACQKRFGVIEGITDRNYLTNSYHVNVEEEIDPFEKILFEAQFQPISSGGCISYIEMANMQHNTDLILEMMTFMYNESQYAEFNTKSDYCHICGFEGEILIDEDLNWYCPNCNNRDKARMNVVRRTCGYLGENFWNEGRTEEIKDRFIHIDNHNWEGDDLN